MKKRRWSRNISRRRLRRTISGGERAGENSYQRQRKRKLLKIYSWTALIMAVVIASYTFLDARLGPVVYEVAKVRVKEITATAINDAVIEYMDERNAKETFLNVDMDENGYISMVSANTVYMNEFSTGITKLIHNNLKLLEGEKVSVRLGSILGSSILTQMGPSVPIKIGSIASASVELFTELESGGINQTKYKVYMAVKGKAKPIIPLSDDEIDISTNVLIAETVIVGQVPQTYLTLPYTSKL